MAIALAVVTLSAFVTLPANNESVQTPTVKVGADDSLIIKQTLTFQDSSEVVIYYCKSDSVYTVHSETDLSKQSPKTLLNLEATTFEVVTEAKGDCYVTCHSIKEVLDLGASLYSQYGNYVDFEKLLNSK